VRDEPDAAAGEADHVDLPGMRADECVLHDAEVEVDRQRKAIEVGDNSGGPLLGAHNHARSV
jgi:hypothetical protein